VRITVRNDESGKSGKRRKAGRSRAQVRFEKLRGQIESQQRKNAKLRKDLDALLRRCDSIRHEHGCAGLDSTRRLGERLIEFFERKSLSEWHREELVFWIGEVIERVASIDQDTETELKRRLTMAMGKHFGLTEDQIRERRQQFEEQMRAEFEQDEWFDEDELSDDFDDDDFDGGGWDEDDFGDGERDESPRGRARDDGPGFESGAERERARRLTDAAWLRSLFRRAARLLHPDRESDPDKREQKHGRMQELLRARKEGDVLAMLDLYAEAGGHQELSLAESEIAQLCDLLRERLDDLQSEYRAIPFQSPLYLWAYETFYGVGKAERERGLRQLEREWRQQAEQDGVLVKELRNLQVLKQHLKKRRDAGAERLRDFDELFGDSIPF